MEKKTIFKVNLEGEDLNSLSIAKITEFYEGGEKVAESKPLRKSFRKLDEEGKENPNFEEDIDKFTGEKDFIKNKVNF
jgi:hypothetical protein